MWRGCRGDRNDEERNLKDVSIMNAQILNDETEMRDPRYLFRHSVFEHLSLIRHSNFVLRHSSRGPASLQETQRLLPGATLNAGNGAGSNTAAAITTPTPTPSSPTAAPSAQ